MGQPVKSIDMTWIVVKDVKQAVKFYTHVVGLKLVEISEEHGWAELQGHQGGSRLGIAQEDKEGQYKAGEHGCITLTVEDVEKAKENLQKLGAKFYGELEVIPGHVKMQTVIDQDGNRFQIVQKL